MDLEQYDPMKDGAHFQDTAFAIFVAMVLAVLAALAGALLMHKWDEALDAQVTAQHVAQATAKKELRPCDFVIVQYGAYHEKRHPECAKGTRDLPNHILTLPVGK